MKYAVVFDRPFYPSIELFETLDAAKASAQWLAKEEHTEGGEHDDSTIYVVEVISTTVITTSH